MITLYKRRYNKLILYILFCDYVLQLYLLNVYLLLKKDGRIYSQFLRDSVNGKFYEKLISNDLKMSKYISKVILK